MEIDIKIEPLNHLIIKPLKKNSLGFTLIEVMVVVGIMVVLMVSVGGIMTSSFKAKNSGENMETVSSESQVIMMELKKNIFDADINTIVCPGGVGTSISFTTKSGGATSLLCNDITSKVSSDSAESGIYSLSKSGITVSNCENFVSCQTSNGKVTSVNFNLKIGITGGQIDQFWDFGAKVAVR